MLHFSVIGEREARGSRQSGFTLLFAVLVGSILVSIGIAIAGIALKEVVLSAAGKESQLAFYAADAGAECALYFDIQEGIFPQVAGSAVPNFTCAETTVSGVVTAPRSDGAVAAEFTLPFADPRGGKKPCADVSVEKRAVTVDGKEKVETVISSRGRNDCGEHEDPSRVERGLRVRYTE